MNFPIVWPGFILGSSGFGVVAWAIESPLVVVFRMLTKPGFGLDIGELFHVEGYSLGFALSGRFADCTDEVDTDWLAVLVMLDES